MRLIYNMQASLIQATHKEFKENVKIATDRYSNDGYLQEYTNDILCAFDKDQNFL